MVSGHVNAGFGPIFKDQQEAERHLGGMVQPAPLGCLSKQKGDGDWEDRVLLDLKASRANDGGGPLRGVNESLRGTPPGRLLGTPQGTPSRHASAPVKRPGKSN